jgi:hypothetical protein
VLVLGIDEFIGRKGSLWVRMRYMHGTPFTRSSCYHDRLQSDGVKKKLVVCSICLNHESLERNTHFTVDFIVLDRVE